MVKGVQLKASKEFRFMWYFLTPTKGTFDPPAGYVNASDFFAMCEAIERSGLPTAWPQSSFLYNLLCEKSYATQMCLHRKFKVPVGTRLSYSEFVEEPELGARKTLQCLQDLREYVYGESGTQQTRGVISVGCRSKHEDPLPFWDENSLVEGVNKLLPGVAHTVCLVRELVAGTALCELYVLCFHDAQRDETYKRYLWYTLKDGGYAEAPWYKIADKEVSEEAIKIQLFDNNDEKINHVKKEADTICTQWLLWFDAEHPVRPHVARIDLTVVQSNMGHDVWFKELGDGACDLGSVEEDVRNTALVNNMMRYTDSASFPQPLPQANQTPTPP